MQILIVLQVTAIAAHHIENSLGNIQEPEHPISLIKKAYGIRA